MLALAAHATLALALRLVATGALSTGHEASTRPREAVVEIAIDVATATRAGAPVTDAPPARALRVAPRRIEAAARASLSEIGVASGGATMDDASAELERGSEMDAGAAWFRPTTAVVDPSSPSWPWLPPLAPRPCR